MMAYFEGLPEFKKARAEFEAMGTDEMKAYVEGLPELPKGAHVDFSDFTCVIALYKRTCRENRERQRKKRKDIATRIEQGDVEAAARDAKRKEDGKNRMRSSREKTAKLVREGDADVIGREAKRKEKDAAQKWLKRYDDRQLALAGDADAIAREEKRKEKNKLRMRARRKELKLK